MTEAERQFVQESARKWVEFYKARGGRPRVGRCIDCTRYYVWNGERCDATGELLRDPEEKYDCFEPGEEEAE